MSKAPGQRKQVRPNRRLWNLGQRPRGRTRRIRRFGWLRKFPFNCFGIICVFLLFEIFTLPIFSIFSLDTKNPKETALMKQRLEEPRCKVRSWASITAGCPYRKSPSMSEWQYWWQKMARSFLMLEWIGMKCGNPLKPTGRKAALSEAGQPSPSNWPKFISFDVQGPDPKIEGTPDHLVAGSPVDQETNSRIVPEHH